MIISCELGILHDLCFAEGSLVSSFILSSFAWHHTVTLSACQVNWLVMRLGGR